MELKISSIRFILPFLFLFYVISQSFRDSFAHLPVSNRQLSPPMMHHAVRLDCQLVSPLSRVLGHKICNIK